MTTRTSAIAVVALFLAACAGPNVTSTQTPVGTPPASTAASSPSTTLAPGATATGASTPSTGASTSGAATLIPATTPTATVTPTAIATPVLTAEPSVSGSITEPFASGFKGLTLVTNAGDGSGDLYVVEQAGRVYKVTKGESVPPDPWLDISERIACCDERGLLGLAFHPDFESNGRFFVDYTNVAGNSVISEFGLTADGTGDAASERVILTQDQPFENHNGGMVAFGPDGYLYIGFGDGGAGGDPMGNGQKLTTFLGKILRIDVDSGDPYGIPEGNPFPGQPGETILAQRPEIWDWGVRNPWRFSFDRESGGLFIGDVGQDVTEEVDVERAGLGNRNYGWNVMEGDHCYQAPSCDQTGLTLPVASYSHAFGCTVIGGYVYRGTRFPDLVGRYFYGDYCSGRVWSFDAGAALAGSPVEAEPFGRLSFSITAFGEDEAGELYVATDSGAIYSFGEF